MAKKIQRRVTSARGKTNRGRISKAACDQILKDQSSELIAHFELYPLRPPIDDRFKAYYEQFLQRDARAILRYYDETPREEDLAGSFYEFLGRLNTIRFYRAADLLLSRVESGYAKRWPDNMESIDHWLKRLVPLCERARHFIRDSRNAGFDSRESLWQAYIFRPLATVRFAYLHGRDNEELLQGAENSQQQNAHREAMQELLAGANVENLDLVRAWLGGAGLKGPELEKQALRSLTRAEVNKFAGFGLIPREMFFDLARTKGNLQNRRFAFTPKQVARVFARRIVGISESSLAHHSSRCK
jgi:hypothetical protein